MNLNKLNQQEVTLLTNQQVFSLENGLSNGKYSLEDIGNLVPGAMMVQDINAMQVNYMNNWGCESLDHSMEEINAMGNDYYKKFFLAEECGWFLTGMLSYIKRKDQSELYSFFHQVRTGPKMELSWHYAVCKFLTTNNTNELIVVANPISGMGLMVNKVNKLLDENVYVAKNYKKFAILTKREKEIISLLSKGKSTTAISDELFISKHTVSTHRKNINLKLDLNSFAELIRFANAFEL